MNPIVTPETTWDQAVFLIEQGKSYYNSWSSTWSSKEAGFREFTAALEVLDRIGISDQEHQNLRLEALEWQGHAFMKSLKYDEALESYWQVVLLQEQMTGRYSHSTELAYQWLSDAYQATGMTKMAMHAIITAARIELELGGPNTGPHQSHLKWEELSLRVGNSKDTTQKQSDQQLHSMHLERRGDNAFLNGNKDLAFKSYQEALDLEHLYWGVPTTPRNVWLNRKAALVGYDDLAFDPNRLSSIESIQANCPAKKYPTYCQHLVRGEEFYLDRELSLASEAFDRAIKSMTHRSVSLPHFLLLPTLLLAITVSMFLLGGGRQVMDKIKQLMDSLSKTGLNLWNQVLMFENSKNESQSSESSSAGTEVNSAADQHLGQTILDAVSDDEDDHDATEKKTNSSMIASDDISAGVRSLGQYLFESDMGDEVVLSTSGHDHSQLQPIGE